MTDNESKFSDHLLQYLRNNELLFLSSPKTDLIHREEINQKLISHQIEQCREMLRQLKVK